MENTFPRLLTFYSQSSLPLLTEDAKQYLFEYLGTQNLPYFGKLSNEILLTLDVKNNIVNNRNHWGSFRCYI